MSDVKSTEGVQLSDVKSTEGVQPPTSGPAITRRSFLRTGGLLTLSSLSAPMLAGCGASSTTSPAAPTAASGTAPAASGAVGGDPWKQFSGTAINFISENTSPTSAIAADLKPFTDLTGITVQITQLELGALVEKVALDFSSGQGSYHVIYADPYQVLSPYYKALADLNQFINDQSLPQVPKGIEDFIPAQLAAVGRFGDEQTLYALPYDCPTMIWIYRKDLFEKYGQQMQQDLGFDPTPSEASTWDQYYQIATWFNDHAKDDVKYGTGHQAKQYDSLMCDFSNILWAYGGDYFQNGLDVGKLGTDNPGPCQLDQPKAIEAATFYQKLLAIAHPGSTSWDWSGVDEAFRAGEIAMVPNWHEFAAGIEGSKLAGKVGYERLPKGPARAADMYGGTGLGINKGAPEKEQKAAWLFLVWATSPETQLAGLKSKVGGGTPTRQSVYDMPELKQPNAVQSMPNIITASAANKAWQAENIGLRPKIPQWNQCDTIIFTELSKMLAGQKTPEQAMRDAKQGFDQTTGAA